MQNRLYIIIVIFVTIHNLIFAQGLEQTITVNYEDQTLETILSHIERDLGLKFSFLQKAIPLDTAITLKLTNQPLQTILDALSEKAGLQYKVVKDHIALFHISPESTERKTTVELPVNLEASVVIAENTVEESEQLTIDTTPHEIEYAQMTGISNKNLIGPQNDLVISSVPSGKHSVSLKEWPRKKSLSLGFVFATDFYRLSGKAGENKDFTYKTGVNYSMGLSADIKIKERWSILVQVLHSAKNFDLYYNFQTTDQEEDPFIPEKTAYAQSYLDIPILLNYEMLENSNWKLSGQAGFVPGFLLNSRLTTYHQDGSEMQTEDFLVMKIRNTLFGAQLGVAATYQVNTHFSLKLTSGWRQYFGGINKENLPTKLGLFQTAATIRYRL